MTHRHRRKWRVPAISVLIIGVTVVAVAGWMTMRVFAADDGPTVADANRDGEGAAASASGKSSPSAAAPKTSTPAPKRRIVIHGTGDVSLDPTYIPAFTTNGYEVAWTGLGGLFERDDLTIINHECPSTDIVDPFPKEFVFRCDPAALVVAKRFGVDVAT
jgi:hypothetical protein